MENVRYTRSASTKPAIGAKSLPAKACHHLAESQCSHTGSTRIGQHSRGEGRRGPPKKSTILECRCWDALLFQWRNPPVLQRRNHPGKPMRIRGYSALATSGKSLRSLHQALLEDPQHHTQYHPRESPLSTCQGLLLGTLSTAFKTIRIGDCFLCERANVQ